MIPPGTKDPNAQGVAAGAMPPTKPGDPVQPCLSCTVTLAPSTVKLCDTTSQKEITATGTPPGGSFSWSSDDPDVVKVTGAGRKATVKALKAGKAKIEVTYKVSGCTCTAEADVQACTCTPKAGGGRWYAYADKNVDKVVGSRAKIKTRYGKVCCEDEDCTTKTGYHVVYANVSNDAGATRLWAQTGYGRERNAGSKTINKYRYAEMNGATYKVNYDTANPPAEGAVHLYQCEVDNTTGKWRFLQDGAEWQTFADAGWKKKTGVTIHFVGEIFNQEDDMPGTDADKCEFTECQYLEQRDDPTEEETPSEVLTDFGFDKSTITPEQAAQIDAIADVVAESWKTPPEVVKIRLVGHTDAVGSPGYNVGLGQRRALAVRGALVDALEAREPGLSAKVKLVTESKGETELADHSGTPEGDAKNRRVEVFLTTNAPAPDWQDAGFAEGDVQSEDDAEWGAEWISDTAFNIWDKKPLD